MAFLAVIFGTYYTYKNFKKVRDKKPHISINNKGITSRSWGFVPWSEIEGEEVIYEKKGKDTVSFLFYFIRENNHEKIKIDELNISSKKLIHLLKTYRIRHTKSL